MLLVSDSVNLAATGVRCASVLAQRAAVRQFSDASVVTPLRGPHSTARTTLEVRSFSVPLLDGCRPGAI